MNWARPRLSEGLADVVRGVTFSRGDAFAEPREDTIAVLRAGNISDRLITDTNLVWVPSKFVSPDQRLQPNDIVICTSSGSRSVVGKSAINEGGFDGTWGAFNAVVRAKPPLNPRFMFCWMQSAEFKDWRDRSATGANIQNIRHSEIASLSVPLPAPSEQHRIVEILDQADALRKQARAADAKAARILPALFLKMFGDPATNPMGWPDEPLAELCNPKQWPTISTRELKDSGFPVYGANGQIGFYGAYNHEHATVLITCRGATCGTVGVCEPKSYVTGNAMALDDPDYEKTSVEFLKWFLRMRGLSDTITGSAQPQITRASLKPVRVFVPDKDLVDHFSKRTHDVEILDEAFTRARTDIGNLFSMLLSRAFSGQLTAKWRQAHMQELLAEMQQQAKLLNLPVPN